MTSANALSAHRLRIVGWGLAACLLLTPLVAMQFTREVAWGPGDFVVAAGVLGGVGVGLELAARLRRPLHRIAVGLGVLALALLVWAELAVGIF